MAFHIDFIGHACLKITKGKLKILTDPWIEGPAYNRQWYHYPLPDRSVPVDDVNYIHYSHGHEDHLHQPTFSMLPKSATALLTRQWFPGNVEWLQAEGFENVREVTSGRWIRLTDPSGTDAVECVNLVNLSDSISILRDEQETLVNVNDALHGFDESLIDHYCRRIRALLKGKPVDYLFGGFAGASFFPNCLRHERKDDRSIAIARERRLAEGFARVVEKLQPRVAFAFASGMVLLEPFNLWINEIKMDNDPVRLVEQRVASMKDRVFTLLPGDRIAAGRLERKHAPRGTEEQVADYRGIYAEEIEAKKHIPNLSADAALQVLERIAVNFRERFRTNRSKPSFDWAIQLRDYPQSILRMTHDGNGPLQISTLPSENIERVRDMVVEANSAVLLACIESMWGGDVLQIGYGGIFHLRSDVSVSANHPSLFLRLATKLPIRSDYLRLAPIRGIDHLLHSPYLTREIIRASFSKIQRNKPSNELAETGKWVYGSKCAGCPVCEFPEPKQCT